MKNSSNKKFICLFIACLLVFFVSGCTNKLKWLDEKLEQGFEKMQSISLDEAIDFINIEEDSEESATSTPKDIIIKEKNKLDAWLEEYNLNRYGDPMGTKYDGGTPLFNKETGERIDRFDYILSKYPNILSELD